MVAWQDRQQSPRVEETTLKTAEVQVERKTFCLTLKQNHQGQFVRITEMGPRKNSIIIPASGVEELSRVLGEMGQSVVGVKA